MLAPIESNISSFFFGKLTRVLTFCACIRSSGGTKPHRSIRPSR